MGNFGHREITITATSCVIKPEDFKSNLHRSEPWGKFAEWNEGPMRHVINALNGTPVVIVVDKRTGFTLVGAVLVDVRGRGLNGQGVAISTECSKTPQNPQGITVYDVRNVGTIIPLQSTTHGQRTAAMTSEARELELAEKVYRATLPEDRPEGSVRVQCFRNEVHAGWERKTYADRRPTPNWMRVTLEQVKAASLCDTCLKAHDYQSHEQHCPIFQVELDARLEAERSRKR